MRQMMAQLMGKSNETNAKMDKNKDNLEAKMGGLEQTWGQMNKNTKINPFL